MSLVCVTEAAAIAAGYWIGKGDKYAVDEAGTEAMRKAFDLIEMDATVVIGEGEIDEAPMLFIGEKLGTGYGPKIDIAVDPIEGTTIVAENLNNALAVAAIAEAGNLLHAPDMYMYKMAVGPKAAGQIDLRLTVTENLTKIAKALAKDISEITVIILDRPRHAAIIEEIAAAGAQVRLISDGDVAAAINTAYGDSGIDVLIGIGGAPEGVLAAVALKCLGGELQGKLMPRNVEEEERCKSMGLDCNKILMMDDLVKGEHAVFAATGVTDGELVNGVKYENGYATTQSILMTATTRMVRVINGIHKL
jgi:fructose-1,6-bisphosphatase II